jgi:hypothetical protein
VVLKDMLDLIDSLSVSLMRERREVDYKVGIIDDLDRVRLCALRVPHCNSFEWFFRVHRKALLIRMMPSHVR